jgi:hypothetical protein
LEAALQQKLSDEKRQHRGQNSQRGDVVNENDTGDVQSALKVFRCRAGRRSSVGNNLVDDCCERYKQIKRMSWIHKKAQTLRELGVFHRHCPHKHAQTKIQKAFSLSFAGSGLLFPVLRQAAGEIAGGRANAVELQAAEQMRWNCRRQSKCGLGSLRAAQEGGRARRAGKQKKAVAPFPLSCVSYFLRFAGAEKLKNK